MTPADSEEEARAGDMIDVHGAQAAAIARGNARGAALAGHFAQARSWIGVLAIIQRQLAAKSSPLHAQHHQMGQLQ